MAYLVYVLEVQSEGLAAEVLLNGASAFHEPLGAARFLQTKLNPYLIAGENELEVRLGPPPPPPEGAPARAPGRSFKLRAFRAAWGVDGPDEALADFEYGGDPALPEQGRVTVVKLVFDAGAAHERWAFQDARPFSVGDGPGVVRVVAEAHAALAARDAAGLGALTSTKREELARALDTPEGELAADERAYLQGFFQAPDWAPAPLDSGALVLTPTAGGRLVQVTDASGRPPLRGVGGGRVMAMSVTVSHLPGGWRIVR